MKTKLEFRFIFYSEHLSKIIKLYDLSVSQSARMDTLIAHETSDTIATSQCEKMKELRDDMLNGKRSYYYDFPWTRVWSIAWPVLA
jgi:hypothetical protein